MLGGGAWHVALPKLQAMESRGVLKESYLDLNLRELESHVECQGEKHIARKRERARTQQQELRQPAGWREPRQPDCPPPEKASASSGGNPDRLEPVDEGLVEAVAGSAARDDSETVSEGRSNKLPSGGRRTSCSMTWTLPMSTRVLRKPISMRDKRLQWHGAEPKS